MRPAVREVSHFIFKVMKNNVNNQIINMVKVEIKGFFN